MVVARVTPEVFEALRRDPGDDAGWQVLADALGEIGDERAEVIRLERQLVGAPPEEREALTSALAKLDKQRKTWARGLPAGVGVARWSRGFVAAISVPATPDAPGLIGRAFSAEVCVLTTGLRLVSAAKAEDPEGEGNDEDDEYAEDCDEDGDELPIVDVAWLAGADLGRVTTLSLAYLNVGPQGAEVLSDHAVLGQLRELDLRGAGLDGEALARLLARPLPRLERLSLQGNELGPRGGAAISSAALPALCELDLRYTGLGDEGVESLLQAPALPRLTALRLYRRDLGERGAAALASSPRLPSRLRTAFLGRTP
jgi:uncharacterized protein (TIGR02996 family)